MIPCVIENGLVVSEVCATQYGVIGTANVVETNLGKYIQLRVSDRRARAKRGVSSRRQRQSPSVALKSRLRWYNAGAGI